MKKLFLISVFLFSFLSIGVTAVGDDQIEILQTIRRKTVEMENIMTIYYRGTDTLEGITFNLPVEAKNQLIAKYRSLKAEIEALWSQLPS